MSFDTSIERMIRMNDLIKRKSTGCPSTFSAKLGISTRHLFRIIDHLKSMGVPIEYSRSRQTYFYFDKGDLVILKWTLTPSDNGD